MFVPNVRGDTLQVDVGCNVRTTIRNVGEHTISLIVKDIAGAIITEMDSCTAQTLKLASGADYMLDYSVETTGLNDTGNVITDVSIQAFQPLVLDANGRAVNLSDPTALNLLTGSSIYSASSLTDHNQI